MAGLIRYPCPLGAGRFALLYLPSDLTDADVKRIVSMIELFPLPPDPVPPAPAAREEER